MARIFTPAMLGSIFALLIATNLHGQRETRSGLIDDRFERFDKNKDGKLSREEMSSRPRLFKVLDRNGDGVVTKSEVQKQLVESDAKQEMIVKRNVSYGKHRSQKLDIYLSKNASRDSPVMVYVHGGGWAVGDKSSVGNKATYFTKAGWVFVSVNYRLIPDGKHPKNVQDVAQAIAWVHDHVEQRGSESIFIMGHSARCHLVALVATDETHLEKAGKSLAIIKGVIALDTQAYDVPEIVQRTDSRLYEKVFGTNGEIHRDASPAHHVSSGKDIPPFLICYSSGMGSRTNPKRASAAHAFSETLAKAEIHSEVVDASDRNHGQINKRFGESNDKKVTLKAMEFLNKIRNQIRNKKP